MGKLISIFIFLFSSSACLAQADDKPFSINGKSYFLKTIPGIKEVHSIQTAGAHELIRIYPYYGNLRDAKYSGVVFFMNNAKYALIEDDSKAKAIEMFLQELSDKKMIRDTVIDAKAQNSFLKAHPLPEGYEPPESFNYY